LLSYCQGLADECMYYMNELGGPVEDSETRCCTKKVPCGQLSLSPGCLM